MRVTATRQIVHRCPYRDELDIGTITISWDGHGIELYELGQYLDSWSDQVVTHEVMTGMIMDHLAEDLGTPNVEVVTQWRTAGMDVCCTSRA